MGLLLLLSPLFGSQLTCFASYNIIIPPTFLVMFPQLISVLSGSFYSN